ncbi:MAG: hypothetical protein HY517_00165 [Candidatus Aenigmarchaeota archaeon]|nr:hypothetical protein [Candidatus Aenigmarchaeota archaeon]
MIYEKFERYWKAWLWIPIILLILSVGVIANSVLATGSFMKRDIELTGGKSITFEVSSADLDAIKSQLPHATVRLTSGVTRNVIIEMPFEADENEVIDVVSANAAVIGSPTVRTVGPSIGNIFFQQAQLALIAAFILMAITVFILFRSVVPSLIVILAATADIAITIAILNLLGVTLSLAVIAALLMVIGYSVDTNMVLTSELLKGRGTVSAGIKRAMKTGLTMTSTIFVALLAMFLLSGSLIIEQIALVLIIATLFDAPTTWMTNAGVLRWWLRRRGRHE